MCELVQLQDQFSNSVYLVTDPQVFVDFYKCVDPKVIEKHQQDERMTFIFGNKIKIEMPKFVKQEKIPTFTKMSSFYMNVKFDMSDHLTVKPSKGVKPMFLEVYFPIQVKYQFKNEYERYEKNEGNEMFSVLGIFTKDTIEPQLTTPNTAIMEAFETGLEEYMNIVYEEYISNMRTKHDENVENLYHKAPYVPIYISDGQEEKPDIKQHVGNLKEIDIYRTNITEPTYTKVTIGFECLNKEDLKKLPIYFEETTEAKEYFAMSEAIRFIKQNQQQFRLLQQDEHDKVHPEMLELYESFKNPQQNVYEFENEDYKRYQKLTESVCQDVMKSLLRQETVDPETKRRGYETESTYDIVKGYCEDDKQQKQYKLETYQKFVGFDGEYETDIVNFAELADMFTIHFNNHIYEFIVSPQFKFGVREPKYIVIEKDQQKKRPIPTMEIETKLIVRELLKQPEALQANQLVDPMLDIFSLDDMIDQ